MNFLWNFIKNDTKTNKYQSDILRCNSKSLVTPNRVTVKKYARNKKLSELTLRIFIKKKAYKNYRGNKKETFAIAI